MAQSHNQHVLALTFLALVIGIIAGAYMIPAFTGAQIFFPRNVPAPAEIGSSLIPSSSNITVLARSQVLLKTGESINIMLVGTREERTIRLLGIGSDGAIVVEVSGLSRTDKKIVEARGTITINGVRITNSERVYPNTAILKIGKAYTVDSKRYDGDDPLEITCEPLYLP